jgi:hypothetical protein
MNLFEKIGEGVVILAVTGAVVYGTLAYLKWTSDCVHYQEEIAVTKQILDVNRNGKVSNEEDAVFSKITGKSFDKSSRDDVRRFLSAYNL